MRCALRISRIEDAVSERRIADPDYFPTLFFRFAQYALIRCACALRAAGLLMWWFVAGA